MQAQQPFSEAWSQLPATSHMSMACARPETKPEQVFPQGALPSISVTIFYVHLGTRYLHQLALTVIQILAIIHEPGAANTHLPAISVFPQEGSAQTQC